MGRHLIRYCRRRLAHKRYGTRLTGAYAPGPVNRSSARPPGRQRVAGRTRLRHEVGGPYRQLQDDGGGRQAVGGAACLVAHGDTHGLVAHAAGRERHR